MKFFAFAIVLLIVSLFLLSGCIVDTPAPDSNSSRNPYNDDGLDSNSGIPSPPNPDLNDDSGIPTLPI